MKVRQTNVIVLLIFLFSVLASLAFLVNLSPFLRGPGIYPPDWRWPYDLSFKFPQIFGPIFISLLIIASVFVKKVQKRRGLVLFTLIFLGFILEISLLYYSRSSINVIFHRISNEYISGYFTTSLSINSIRQFLSGFNSNLGNYPMYAKFHPPLSILFFDFLNRASQLFSGHLEFINHFHPSHGDVSNVWNNLKDYQKFTVLYSGFLIGLISMLTIIPVYLTTKLLYSKEAAVKSVYLFVLCPAILLFIPENDVFLPLLTSVSFYFFVKGLIENKFKYYFLAGLILSIGVYFSLTFLPFVLFFAIYYLFRRGFKLNLKDINNGFFFSFGFLLLPLIFQIFGNNFIEMTIKIMGFHETAQHHRAYFTWIFYNLYDFFIFVGLPTVLLFLASVFLGFTKKIKKDLLVISFFIFLIILDLSGSVRGETGRIWIPMIPFMIIGAGGFLEQIKVKRNYFALILAALAIQILVFQTVLVVLY